MAPSRPFLDLTLAEWLDELASARAAPGGGSALAVALANAAAVLAMAARVSDAGGLVAQAEALRARTAPLAQVDADTYAEALAVRDAAGELELRQEQRDWEIGKAFARAAEPPLEIARAAADVAELAAELARNGAPEIRADAVAAAALAAGVARGCVTMVEVNLTAVEGDPRVAEAARLADSAAAAAARAAAG